MYFCSGILPFPFPSEWLSELLHPAFSALPLVLSPTAAIDGPFPASSCLREKASAEKDLRIAEEIPF